MRLSTAVLFALVACRKPAPIVPAPEPEPETVAVPDEPPYPTDTYGEVTFDESVVNVVPGGDIDGDGLADLLIALPGSEVVHVLFGQRLAQVRPGQALLFDRTLHSPKPGIGFGQGVAGMGDVDGDGLGEVLLGASGWDAGAGDAGGAWLMLGKTLRDDPTAGLDQAWTFYWGAKNDQIGAGVASLGDLDGDGRAEALIPGYRRAYVVTGAELPSFERMYLPEAKTTLVGVPEGSRFDLKVRPAGDTLGNGMGGALITSAAAGRAWLFHGQQLGTKILDLSKAAQGRFVTPGQWQGAVAGACDLNGDRRPDLLVGWEDGAYVVGAVDAGYFTTPSEVDVAATAFLTLDGDQDWAIEDVTSLGDLDGDGYAEMAIGTRMEGGSYSARVFVFRGIKLRNSSRAALAQADLVFDYPVDRQSFWFTTHVTDPGDVNGDGQDDLVVLLEGHGWQDPTNTAAPKVIVHLSPYRWKD